MSTPVHAGALGRHNYPAVRDLDAGCSQAAQARAKSPRQLRQFRRTGSLPGGWLVGDNGNRTVMPHPVEKWSPIRGRVDVARR